MDRDEEFLRAIADNHADDSARLIYADWLDERGDSRGEFLRIQANLAGQISGDANSRRACQREKELIGELDPHWIQRVRRYSTAPPCRDVVQLVPDLAPFVRSTTRLHPHRAVAPGPIGMSKIGGRFLWPANEPWPMCEPCQTVLTPVLQLRRRDVPDLKFPPRTNLLQLFWCPDEAAHDYSPSVKIWWRKSESVTHARTDAPDLSAFPRESDWQGYIPFECCVFPERVVEYPMGDDLWVLAGPEAARSISTQIDELEVDTKTDLKSRFEGQRHVHFGSVVHSELGQCPGTKVGGKPSVVRGGRRFDHLVTFSTWETDSASFYRWLAAEDQRLLAPPGKPLTVLTRSSGFESVQKVLGMQLGRTQRAHIFVCRDSKPWDVFAYVND